MSEKKKLVLKMSAWFAGFVAVFLSLLIVSIISMSRKMRGYGLSENAFSQLSSQYKVIFLLIFIMAALLAVLFIIMLLVTKLSKKAEITALIISVVIVFAYLAYAIVLLIKINSDYKIAGDINTLVGLGNKSYGFIEASGSAFKDVFIIYFPFWGYIFYPFGIFCLLKSSNLFKQYRQEYPRVKKEKLPKEPKAKTLTKEELLQAEVNRLNQEKAELQGKVTSLEQQNNEVIIEAIIENMEK